MAAALKTGYGKLYERNEYAHSLNRKELEGLVVEATGLTSADTTVKSIVGTFETLKALADFDAKASKQKPNEDPDDKESGEDTSDDSNGVKLNLAYSINLVLPKTDDVAVFNAIFSSLRQHLLKK